MVRHEGETRDSAGQEAAESPRSWTLELPLLRPTLTLNAIQGRHWSRVKTEKGALNEAAYYLSRTARMPRPITRPVTVELIYWPGNNTVHDSDNIAPTLKYLVDGLRQAGVLTDDRGRYVRSSICTVIERDDDPEHRTDARVVLVVREL